MQVPVMFSLFVALTELNEATDKFRVRKVLMIVHIEQNFVARHLFEIKEVVDGRSLVFVASTNQSRLHFDILGF